MTSPPTLCSRWTTLSSNPIPIPIQSQSNPIDRSKIDRSIKDRSKIDQYSSTTVQQYNTVEQKFQTLNIVIVFSNEKPDCEKLSKDRWKISKIIGEDLLDITKNIKYK